jgi:hypothetical protein
MDLDSALALAGSESTTFVNRAAAKCPADKTGLLVLVYRKDTSNAISGGDVTANGAAGKTDGNGIAHDYKPCAPAKYNVRVTALPKEDKLYAKPYPTAQKSVSLGSCPICSLPVNPRKYWVKIRLVDKETGKDAGKSKGFIKLPDGWKYKGEPGDASRGSSVKGSGDAKQRLIHFKDITPDDTGDADKCKIQSIEVDECWEFDELTEA